jgi:outer membrane protein OmpA-like peptidoglycan-associated protein
VKFVKTSSLSDVNISFFHEVRFAMKMMILAMLAVAFTVPVFAQDADGCKDYPLFNRMPHTTLVECSAKFNQLEFYAAPENYVTKEGMLTTLVYDWSDGTDNFNAAPSFLQIVKNYENSIAKQGCKRTYFSADDMATLYLKTKGKEMWFVFTDASHLGKDKGSFQLGILEIEEMKQEILASDILQEINKNGHIALYINFETGKSAIKAESQNIVDQIVTMLKENESLQVSIEGHTDNVGQAVANQKLSEDRANSVMNAIVKGGIDKTRLAAKGWGQTTPIADNKTEENRALNRRVEIVKK